VPSEFNDWRLVSLSPFPIWALLVLGGLAALAVFLASRGLKREARPERRRVLLALRSGAALAALLLVLEPGVELLATTPVRARVAVLVDASRSMSLPARGGAAATRAEEAARWVEEGAAGREKLSPRFQFELYEFDADARPYDAASARAAKGAETDLLGALAQAARAGPAGRPLAGLVVVSDGADNVDLARGMDRAAEERLQSLGAPVIALGVGTPALKDLAISRVAVDDFAFVRNTVEVEIEITARGMQASGLPVTLKREGRVVASKSLDVSSNATVKLAFIPDTTGEFAYTVSIPVMEGEAVASNNSRSFTLKVIRDRVRVLLIAGRPSWDERFLRMLLKRDPNVDLISFFILRTPTDLPGVGQDELSLIPFPVDEIFREQLHTFDLVIFQNFDHRPYQMAHYLPGMAEYVRGGGAVAMLGGERSFTDGGYGETALAEALPVELLPPGAQTALDADVLPRLTAQGRRHPVTRLVPGETDNDKLWSSLPALPGMNLVQGPKAGAQVLLDSPWGQPLLAVWEHGRGRVLALMSDGSWFWSFLAAGRGLGARAHDTFWHNAIRWLVRDPELTPVKVGAQKESYEPGEEVALEISAREGDYGPAAGAEVTAELVSAEDGKVVASGQTGADAEGQARIVLQPPGAGAYRAVAVARRGGRELGRAEDAFVVAPGGPELADAAPRHDLLRAVADATGGAYLPLADASVSDLPLRDPRRVEVGHRKSEPFWDRWPFLAAVVLFAGAEWFLRRRWGYL
jgi:uncharacterized membrane protein